MGKIAEINENTQQLPTRHKVYRSLESRTLDQWRFPPQQSVFIALLTIGKEALAKLLKQPHP